MPPAAAIFTVLSMTAPSSAETIFNIPHTIPHLTLKEEVDLAQSLGLAWKKLNLTQQKHAFTNQTKYNIK